ETSRSGSSTSTVSPTFFNHWVTVPSVTLSPRSGMETDVGMVPHWIWARYLPEVCPGSADVTGGGPVGPPLGGAVSRARAAVCPPEQGVPRPVLPTGSGVGE